MGLGVFITQSKRFYSLDLWRGIAAVAILLFHYSPSITQIFKNFYIFVDLFFILSGFVLFDMIQKVKSANNLKCFILSRFYRLFPLAWFVLFSRFFLDLINILFVKNIDNPERLNYAISIEGLSDFFFALLLLQVFSLGALYWLMPLWSLSAEWLIYLISAILKMFRLSLKILSLSLIACGVLLLLILIPKNVIQINEIGPIFGFIGMGRAILGFGIGLLLKSIFNRFENKHYFLNNFSLLIALLSLIYLLISQTSYQPLLSFAIFSIVIYTSSNVSLRNGYLIKVSKLFGSLSYSIYLWHVVALSVVINLSSYFNYPTYIVRFSNLDTMINFVSAVLLTLLLSTLSWYIVEKPFLTKSRYYTKSL